MSLEELGSIDSTEGWRQSNEISEKYKESVKKSSTGIKKTQRDEKKAKKYDFMLAKFLVELILKSKYDTLLEKLFSALDMWYGTNFLLGVLSLVYAPISHDIRKTSWLPKIHFDFTIPDEPQNFHPEHIPEQIRNRINNWIDDMHSVVRLEASSIITERSLWLIIYDTTIRDFTRDTLMFFFWELNYIISSSTAESYTDFILKELEKTFKEILPELRKDWANSE